MWDSVVAIPVFGRVGHILAAVNSVATESTFHNEFIEKVGLPKARDISDSLSGFMGYTRKSIDEKEKGIVSLLSSMKQYLLCFVYKTNFFY
ncbi:hypothetical protein V7075_03435 [Neobacillus drentensis]|uniref:hypothetical protein n=1 Tax=Neobacillus drentensis TaxID=220684 RepID=UPI003000B87D